MDFQHQIEDRLTALSEKLTFIENLLLRNNKPENASQKLNFKNAITFLNANGFDISKSSLYKLTSANKVPFMKFGRRLLFDKTELSKWCTENLNSLTNESDVAKNLATTLINRRTYVK